MRSAGRDHGRAGVGAAPPVCLRPPRDGHAPAPRAGDDPAGADCHHPGLLFLPRTATRGTRRWIANWATARAAPARGWTKLLALLGATADSFEAASTLLERLTLVHVCPNLARAATETLGQALQAAEQQAVTAAWGPGTLPTAVATPPRLCLSMDGVLVHTEEGWREYKLGSVYTTATRPSTTHPGQEEVYAQDVSYVGDVTDAATFGQRLWCEAARRGVLTAQEVVIVADGAHWIWDLAAEHFAGATQIVDWYHATHYVWQAAHAVYGEGTPLAKRWAKRRLAELWAGQVPKVLAALRRHQERGAAVRTR